MLHIKILRGESELNVPMRVFCLLRRQQKVHYVPFFLDELLGHFSPAASVQIVFRHKRSQQHHFPFPLVLFSILHMFFSHFTSLELLLPPSPHSVRTTLEKKKEKRVFRFVSSKVVSQISSFLVLYYYTAYRRQSSRQPLPLITRGCG